MNIRTKLYLPGAAATAYVLTIIAGQVGASREGATTLGDEFFILAASPLAVLALRRCSGVPLKGLFCFLGYMLCLCMSTALDFDRGFDVPLLAAAIGIALELKVVLLFLSLYFFARRAEPSYWLYRICRGLFALGFLHACLMVMDIAGSGTSWSGVPLRPSSIFGYIPVGLFGHKYQAATFMALCIVATTALYLHTVKHSYLFSLVLFSLLLFFCDSAKELVAPILSLFVLLHRTWRTSRARSAILLVGATLLIPVALPVYVVSEHILNERLDAYVRDTSVRSLMYGNSLTLASERVPFGTGAGTFGSQPTRTVYFSPLYHTTGLSEHYGASEVYSDYLMDTWWPKVLAESGFLGLVMYILFVSVFLLRALANYFSTHSPISAFAAMLGLVVIASSLASALFTADVGLLVIALFMSSASLSNARPSTINALRR